MSKLICYEELTIYTCFTYLARGISKYMLGIFEDACKDGLKARNLGADASALIKIVCN